MSSSIAPGELRTQGGHGVMLRMVAALAGLAGYQALAHWAAVAAPGSGLTALVAFVPLAVLVLWAGFRRGALGACVALAALCAALVLVRAWPSAARILPPLPQLVICSGLAWMFGRTLLAGREPLVTRLARSVHGALPAPIVAYTRNVTLAWTLFLTAMAVVSTLLYVLTPPAAWSLFANVLFLPLVVLMFLAEYAHRTLRYGWFSHSSIAQSVAAFRRLRASADPRVR